MGSHYQTLGVGADATAEQIRAAYREVARTTHPDRAGGDEIRMAAVNEAYRVLSDSNRRAEYDRTMVSPASAGGDADEEVASVDTFAEPPLTRPTRLAPAGPARVPWKLMAIAASVGTVVVLAASAFDDPPQTEPPDGILRPGSCVAFEPNGDVREVACSGADDVVVEVLVPLDATCPGGTVGHRDRLGLGIACIPA